MYNIDQTKFIYTSYGDQTMWMNIENSEFLELNSTATHVVELIMEQPQDLNSLVSKVCVAYQIEPEECSSDIKEVIETLVHSGLIKTL
jgi:hypothetical protein